MSSTYRNRNPKTGGLPTSRKFKELDSFNSEKEKKRFFYKLRKEKKKVKKVETKNKNKETKKYKK